MKRIDLHIHTNASDGVYTPEEVVEVAKANQMDIIAVSDHDNIKNSAPTIQLAKMEGITCIPAIEATANYQQKEIHILGYGIDLAHPKVLQYVEDTYKIRYDKEIRIIERAEQLYGPVSMQDFKEFAKTKQRGGFLSYNYLKNKGVITELREFLNLKDELNLEECPFQRAEDVVQLLQDIGAVIVLAHPSYHFPNDVAPKEFLNAFTEMGIHGVECFSPYNDQSEQIKYYIDYCNANDLAISGGSDCHGPYLTREMGTPYVTTETSTIMNYLKEYR